MHGARPTAAPTECFERWCDNLRCRFLGPVLPVIAITLALAGVFLMHRAADLDLFARVAVGKLVLESPAFPLQDPFAFTPKKERWIDHEWLSGVVFYLTVRGGGEFGLFALKVLMVCLTLGLVSAAQTLLFPLAPARTFVLALTAVGLSPIWLSTVRSQVFTYFFLALTIAAMQYCAARRRSSYAFLLVPLLALWANMHGGFVLGLAVMGCFALQALRERDSLAPGLWSALLAAVAATLCTPYGVDYWRYIIDALSMPRPTITEWDALEPLSAHAFGIALVAAAVVWPVACGAVRPPLAAALFLSFALFAGIRHIRLLAVFFLAAGTFGLPMLQYSIDRVVRGLGVRALMVKRACAAGLALGAIAGAAAWGWTALTARPTFLQYDRFPVAALAWLSRNAAGGDVLIDFNRGSFGMWRLYPKFLISVDGRYEELYPEETVRMVSTALSPADPGFHAALATVAPDYVVADKELLGEGGITAFAPRFSKLYDDERFSILARADCGPCFPLTPVSIDPIAAVKEVWIAPGGR